MKREWGNLSKFAGLAGVAVLALFSLSSSAQAMKPKTIKGELLDMNCYMAKGAHGASHKSCAEMCISGGGPVGILTSSGKVYLLVENHDKPDAYAQARKYAAQQISVTGQVANRGGVQALVVDDVKAGM